jgi:hypothetical protein
VLLSSFFWPYACYDLFSNTFFGLAKNVKNAKNVHFFLFTIRTTLFIIIPI